MMCTDILLLIIHYLYQCFRTGNTYNKYQQSVCNDGCVNIENIVIQTENWYYISFELITNTGNNFHHKCIGADGRLGH